MCVLQQRLNKIARVVTFTCGKVQPLFFLRRAHGRVAVAQVKVTFVSPPEPPRQTGVVSR